MAICRESSSNSNMCDLGDDLLMNILSRVPLKPLAICKCVSKTFRFLALTLIYTQTRPWPISGIFFCVGLKGMEMSERFFQCLRRDDDELVVEDDNKINYKITFFSSDQELNRVLDCCKGFILYGHFKSSLPFEYYVCNPVTRQKVALPQPPGQIWGDSGVFFLLIIDESPDAFVYHFKVLQFIISRRPKPNLDASDSKEEEEDDEFPFTFSVSVYSSKKGQWEEPKVYIKDVDFTVYGMPPTVLINGYLFYVVSHFQFLKLGVDEASWELHELPIDLGIRWHWDTTFLSYNRLGVYEGCLHFAHHNGLEMKVWMIVGEDYSRWVLKHRVSLYDIDFSEPSKDTNPRNVDSYSIYIIGFHPNLDAIFFKRRGGFFCYDFKSKKLEHFASYPCSSIVYASPDVYLFSECLCSLADAHWAI